MSSLMLCHLNDLVAAGLKTSKGFKKHMYNGCARAINEKFSTRINGEQVKNHLKTWQKRYAKIIKLKKLSAALFDEDNCMITLDNEHYNSYVQVIDHLSSILDLLSTASSTLTNFSSMIRITSLMQIS